MRGYSYIFTLENGSETLAHYGVLGMKWGVRKQESAARLRRGLTESVSDVKIGSISKETLDTGKLRVKGLLEDALREQSDAQKRLDSTIEQLKKEREEYWYSDSFSPRDRADEGVQRLFEKFTTEAISDEVSAANTVLSLNIEDKVPRIQGDHSFDDDMAVVNTLKGVTGYQDNCACCTAATILRRKGFDVVADVRGDEGTTYGDQEKWFAGGKFKNVLDTGGGSERAAVRASYLDSIGGESAVTDWGKADRGVFKSWMVHDEPEGSYGFLNGQYDSKYGSGGHSILYEIKNGDVVCRDGQTGERYDSFYDATKKFDLHRISYMRADDKQPDWVYLSGQKAVKYRNDYYD